MSQTSVSASMTISRKGAPVDTSLKVDDSFVAEGNATFGLLVERGTDKDKQAKPLSDISAIVADDDSITATPLASAASAQEFSGSDFDSTVYGADRISPAQELTLILNSHADWLDSEVNIVYERPDGSVDVKTLAIPSGGNVTLRSGVPVSRVERVKLDTQGGTNGTMKIGTDPDGEIVLSKKDFPGVALYDNSREPYSAAAEIEDKTPFNVRTFGRVKVQVEAAVEPGDPAFVRTTESGAELRGQFRGTPAAGFHRLEGAYFLTSADAAGLATLELK